MLRVAIDFRPIATQVIFDPDWAIIQSGLLYLNISYPNFNFFEYRERFSNTSTKIFLT